MLALFMVVVVLVAGAAAAVVIRSFHQADSLRTARTYRLRFPRDATADEVVPFVAGLSGLRPRRSRRWLQQPVVRFEVHAADGRIEHYLSVATELEAIVTSQLRAALPSVRLEPVPGLVTPHLTSATEVRVSTLKRPLRPDRVAATSAAVLSSLQPLAEDEAVVIQLLVSPALFHRPARLDPRAQRSSSLALADEYRLEPHMEAVKEERAKQFDAPFVCTLRIGVRAAARGRGAALLDRVLAGLQLLSSPGVELRRRTVPTGGVVNRLMAAHAPLLAWPSVLNAWEVAGVLAWPIGITALPGLDLGGCRQLPPPVDVPSEGCVIGTATYPGSERSVAIAPEDRLLHLAITGPTGSGKSNLLLNLVVQDMASGRGVVLVDVKGDLVAECLVRVPKGREGDVIVLDPSDLERPVGINLLSTEFAAPELVADQVVQVFKTLFEDFWGPRSDDLLRAVCLTLMRDPASTLVDIVPLLTNEAFRRRFVALVQDDTVGLAAFWKGYAALRPNDQAQVIGPVMNKARQILLRPAVSNCVGQSKPRLDLGEAMNSGKLLFVSLPEGLLGDEAASLLGSLLVSRLWQYAQARSAVPSDQRARTHLYVDEAHRLVGSAARLGDMLALARSQGMGVTLATQLLQQWPTDLRQEVLTNCRSQVVFQLTAKDARAFEAEFRPFLTAEDLQGLGRFEIAARLAANQQVAPPLTAQTNPPTPPSAEADEIRTLSRERYGRDRQAIEADQRARHAVASTAAPIGRQRKRGAA